MKAKNLSIHKCSQWQVIKQISKIFPDIGISIFAETFVIKSVNLCNLTRFVVSTEYSDPFSITNLEKKIISIYYILAIFRNKRFLAFTSNLTNLAFFQMRNQKIPLRTLKVILFLQNNNHDLHNRP